MIWPTNDTSALIHPKRELAGEAVPQPRAVRGILQVQILPPVPAVEAARAGAGQ